MPIPDLVNLEAKDMDTIEGVKKSLNMETEQREKSVKAGKMMQGKLSEKFAYFIINC